MPAIMQSEPCRLAESGRLTHEVADLLQGAQVAVDRLAPGVEAGGEIVDGRAASVLEGFEESEQPDDLAIPPGSR